MGSEENDEISSSPETRKRFSKAVKKNRNLLAKKEELRSQVGCLEEQIKELKSEAEKRDPLVKAGAAVRMRYLELEKVDRLGNIGRLDRRVIEAGNIAAHAENGAADWSLTYAGLGSTAVFGDVFHAIYGLDYAAYDVSRYCLCRPCELVAEVNRFYGSRNTQMHREIASRLHDEFHTLNGGIHDEHEHMTVEGDSKSAVLINRLEALVNELLAIDVPGHKWTSKDFVPLDERDHEASYSLVQLSSMDSQTLPLSGRCRESNQMSTEASVWSIRYHYKEDLPSKLESGFPSLKEMEVLCRDSVFVDY
ncbi:uncharacterized protein LY89DRAFT_47189 [Mollisia scopiformis]|uniref:Uncharacterized protein n=1 Tax=Mollisia scopiformis TaxID=149040 RepID=A0A194XF36_MOLSC|nr:uncharacterized protein LY89DRAFT_47189 [Mollisia scopiformis]KUJ18382.1 hypothetical protein LY89DRAFT_47189 [Mollisia scopiformis]